MTTTDNDEIFPSIARIIVDQLGRGAFVMMGAKNLLDTGRGLQFKIGRNAKGVTHVRIELDPSDTYTVSFHKVRGTKCVELSSYSDIYVDMLHSLIEEKTGMYLQLPTVFRGRPV